MSLNRNTPPRYLYTETKAINGIDAEIMTSSPYPIPWNSSSARPNDYYEQQSKLIRYYKDDIDQDNHPIRRKIEIEIPTVKFDFNRKRVMSVKVDGMPVPFNINKVLDMNQTFTICDVNYLLQMVRNATSNNNNPQLFQTITPFIYLKGVGEDQDSYWFNLEHNGDIRKLLFPYIEAMCHLTKQSVDRELLLPVATKGGPHHWNLGLLSIDKNNIPSFAYIESENILGDFDYQTYLFYMQDYANTLLPIINSLLSR